MHLDSVRSLKAQLRSDESLKKLHEVHRRVLKRSRQNVATAASLAEDPQQVPSVLDLIPGLGVTHHRGEFHLAVRVYDQGPSTQAIIEHLKAEARNEVHVRVIGEVVALEETTPWYQCKKRPLQIGCSAAEMETRGGTLACIVTEQTNDGKVDYLLSNSHVFAREGRAKPGAQILQPGIMDDNKASARVGELRRSVPLKPTGNLVDCALSTIDAGIQYSNHLEGFGNLAGVRKKPLDHHEVLHKIGRTTGCTSGQVSALEVDGVRVKFGVVKRSFDDQIEVSAQASESSTGEAPPFSMGGDSGSLVFDDERYAVGLLFAGNGGDTAYVNHIGFVLESLGVSLAD